MSGSREVVITGLGVVCPLGVGQDALWAALDAGQSGVAQLTELAGADTPFTIGGRLRGFDAKDFVQPRKTLKVMSGEIQAAYAAAMLAFKHAGIEKGSVAPERLGVVLGSELLYGELAELSDSARACVQQGEFHFDHWAPSAMKNLFPLWMLKYLPNMAACHIGIALDARGPNNSIVEGGVSSLLALHEAAHVIERGHADVMLAGGSGSQVSFNALTFRDWKHLSRWRGDPTQACRPFDATRDGAVLGEGAGAVVLELRERAERRGANILARFGGGGSRIEPLRPELRQGTAIQGAINAALREARVQPADIGCVIAAASGKLAEDALEARAIRATLGDAPVTAPKSFFGDLGAGSGMVELIAGVLALMHQRVPRTLNYQQPDSNCPINVVHGASLPIRSRAVATLNQSNTGLAAATVLLQP